MNPPADSGRRRPGPGRTQGPMAAAAALAGARLAVTVSAVLPSLKLQIRPRRLSPRRRRARAAGSRLREAESRSLSLSASEPPGHCMAPPATQRPAPWQFGRGTNWQHWRYIIAWALALHTSTDCQPRPPWAAGGPCPTARLRQQRRGPGPEPAPHAAAAAGRPGFRVLIHCSKETPTLTPADRDPPNSTRLPVKPSSLPCTVGPGLYDFMCAENACFITSGIHLW